MCKSFHFRFHKGYEMMNIILTLAVSLSISFLLGILLGTFKRVFYVAVDPKVALIRSVLPGANCGACGYPGCDGFASAVAKGEAKTNGCPVGSSPVAKKIGEIMGVSADASKKIAVLLCQGSHDVCENKSGYVGVRTCMAAKVAINGTKNCDWGCIGFGDCEHACPFDAIHVREDGLPFVDIEKCTGCGICVSACPQHILATIGSEKVGAIALCSCRNPKKSVIMKNCKRGCIKCMKCERVCETKAIKVTDGIPVVDYSLCTSCGKCIEECPTKVLGYVQDKVTMKPCDACPSCA